MRNPKDEKRPVNEDVLEAVGGGSIQREELHTTVPSPQSPRSPSGKPTSQDDEQILS